jgi:hypothetical protein
MLVFKEKFNANNDVIASTVYLDGRNTGIIKLGKDGWWRYFPKGNKPGDAFPTLASCKRSLQC